MNKKELRRQAAKWCADLDAILNTLTAQALDLDAQIERLGADIETVMDWRAELEKALASGERSELAAALAFYGRMARYQQLTCAAHSFEIPF